MPEIKTLTINPVELRSGDLLVFENLVVENRSVGRTRVTVETTIGRKIFFAMESGVMATVQREVPTEAEQAENARRMNEMFVWDFVQSALNSFYDARQAALRDIDRNPASALEWGCKDVALKQYVWVDYALPITLAVKDGDIDILDAARSMIEKARDYVLDHAGHIHSSTSEWSNVVSGDRVRAALEVAKSYQLHRLGT